MSSKRRIDEISRHETKIFGGVKILNDPNSRFSTIPDGTMKYAEFMAQHREAGVVEGSVLSAASCGRGKLIG